MESSLFRYIWKYTRRDQLWIVLIVIVSMIPYYMLFDLPKQIVNGPITGIGFEQADATVPFLRFEFDLPLIGNVLLFPGIPMERIPLLVALSLMFLTLVVVNGLFKVYINTYKGRLGERLLRRIRFDLVDRILRFPPNRFKSVKAGEISSMVKDEVEPLGGFSSDAFVQPALLGGQALTALLFIFVQHFWLGMLAAVMATIQVLIIPRLRRRLIILGRERQLTARQLAGRVSEIVDGIDTIRVSDTTNYVRADIVARLGRIFKIRYDIYQWKFFVKFLNNFIAQMTPFLFYMIGGYLTIIGRLDVGQLVAVINAYKELPGPMKELIDYDLARQDVQVKYEQVMDQFKAEEMIDPSLQAVDTSPLVHGNGPLEIKTLSLADDTGTSLLSHTSLSFDKGTSVAFVGSAGSGADALAGAVARLIWPANGRVQIGEQDILQIPESVSGRLVSYASPDEYFFSGTLFENLTYALKNAPRRRAEYDGAALEERHWHEIEAGLAGNPVLDFNDQWIDEEALLEHTGTDTFGDAITKILEIVEMRDDIVDLALRTHLDRDRDAELAEAIVAIRAEFQAELEANNMGHVVVPFEPGKYNQEASVGENLLFGRVIAEEGALLKIVSSDFFRSTLRESGLGELMYRAGHAITEMSLGLLHDLPPDHIFFDRMKLFTPEEIPEYQRLVQRAGVNDFETVTRDDRSKLMRICALYTENWYRFGALTEEISTKVVEVREQLQRTMPDDIRRLIAFYDPDQYLFEADIRENILFGKINSRQNNAEDHVMKAGETVVLRHEEVADGIFDQGLSFDIGPGGRRLSTTQRSKLNLARALLRNSDYYVLNRPLLGIDRGQQTRIIRESLNFLMDRNEPPGVIWVLAEEAHAEFFDRIVAFDAGSVIEDSPKAAYLERTGTS